jgi:conjugative transposon TraN protein
MAFAPLVQGQQSIGSIPLSICCNRTSNLIFPYGIVSVDRGNRDVLAQKAAAVENILQVKAGRPEMESTNLTVITSDGKFYSFLVSYSKNPGIMNWSFGSDSLAMDSRPILFSNIGQNKSLMDSLARKIPSVHYLRKTETSGPGLRLRLRGMAILQGMVWLRLELRNSSSLDYRAGSVTGILRNTSQVSRTATQEEEVSPVYKQCPAVPSGTRGAFVLAFPPFFCPPNKEFVVELRQTQPKRLLMLRIAKRMLSRAL